MKEEADSGSRIADWTMVYYLSGFFDEEDARFPGDDESIRAGARVLLRSAIRDPRSA